LLHGHIALYPNNGIVVCAGLLVAGWWFGRRDGDPNRMAAAPRGPLGTPLAFAVNRPIVALVHEQRPYDVVAAPGRVPVLT
jgi:undecaprenyl-diphosphatase